MKRNLKLISEIGAELRRIRNYKGTSLQEIAEKSDVSTVYISEIERSKKIPSSELIKKLAILYNVNEIDLYEGFKKIPERVEDEIMGNSLLFELLFKISYNPKLSSEDKEKYLVNINDMYDKLF